MSRKMALRRTYNKEEMTTKASIQVAKKTNSSSRMNWYFSLREKSSLIAWKGSRDWRFKPRI